jgi:hypothetical protein
LSFPEVHILARYVELLSSEIYPSILSQGYPGSRFTHQNISLKQIKEWIVSGKESYPNRVPTSQ